MDLSQRPHGDLRAESSFMEFSLVHEVGTSSFLLRQGLTV